MPRSSDGLCSRIPYPPLLGFLNEPSLPSSEGPGTQAAVSGSNWVEAISGSGPFGRISATKGKLRCQWLLPRTGPPTLLGDTHRVSNGHPYTCRRRRSAKTKANIWHRNEALVIGAATGPAGDRVRLLSAHRDSHTRDVCGPTSVSDPLKAETSRDTLPPPPVWLSATLGGPRAGLDFAEPGRAGSSRG